jgi:ribonuclease Z
MVRLCAIIDRHRVLIISAASSILLRAPNAGNILFDVGEGTWGQLARHYGTDREAGENVWDVLEDLKIIFISHIHGDHILGLGRLLAEIKKVKFSDG